MKSPNSEITEKGRRKGRNKKNVGFKVKMDFLFYLVSENEKEIEIFFLLRKTNCRKSKKKKTINFNHEIL